MSELQKLAKIVHEKYKKKDEAYEKYAAAKEKRERLYKEVSTTWGDYQDKRKELYLKFPKELRRSGYCDEKWRKYLMFRDEKLEEKSRLEKLVENMSRDLLYYRDCRGRISEIDEEIEKEQHHVRKELGFYELLREKDEAKEKHEKAKKDFEAAKIETSMRHTEFRKAVEEYKEAEKRLSEYERGSKND
ncbi:hypothetical protein IKD57_01510 [Candidatus Saccharibacteria bacterium]|nr:hypothetical protein [Candidatus Saccharibacteria bacterium]